MVHIIEDRVEYLTPYKIDFSVCADILLDSVQTKNASIRFSINYGRSFPSGESALRQEWAQIYQVIREGKVIQKLFFPKRREVAFVHCFREYDRGQEKKDKITIYSQDESIISLQRIEELVGFVEEE
ncbi:MAG: hypothetical protein RL557_640 [archaeon]|jgi:hypothetical protein